LAERVTVKLVGWWLVGVKFYPTRTEISTIPKSFWRNSTRNVGNSGAENHPGIGRAFFIDVSTKSNVLRRMNCDKR